MAQTGGGTGDSHTSTHGLAVYPLDGRRAMLRAMDFPLTPLSAPALNTLIAKERDAHRLQRELVRASLLRCPR
jgi:hypothetical protein